MRVICAMLFLLTFNSCSEEVTNDFELTYIYAGLGSGMESKRPRLEIKGEKLLYTKQQNSSTTGIFDEKIDTIYQGEFRTTSIDSIKTILNKLKESRIYETNTILSGGIYYISVSYDTKKIGFTLHNACHQKAEEVIEIVNSNVPSKYSKLPLWDDNRFFNEDNFFEIEIRD